MKEKLEVLAEENQYDAWMHEMEQRLECRLYSAWHLIINPGTKLWMCRGRTKQDATIYLMAHGDSEQAIVLGQDDIDRVGKYIAIMEKRLGRA